MSESDRERLVQESASRAFKHMEQAEDLLAYLSKKNDDVAEMLMILGVCVNMVANYAFKEVREEDPFESFKGKKFHA